MEAVMPRLLSRIPLFIAGVPLHVQAATQEAAGGASSDSDFMIWVVVVLVAIFGGLGFATWQLIKTERGSQSGSKPPQ
jgi:hypothetical protein